MREIIGQMKLNELVQNREKFADKYITLRRNIWSEWA